MRFWDTSALLPLLMQESRTNTMIALMDNDPAVAVWWLTRVECWSALARLEREQRLTQDQVAAADALQLEGALVLSTFEPKTLPFVTLDERLAGAARREGFQVVSG